MPTDTADSGPGGSTTVTAARAVELEKSQLERGRELAVPLRSASRRPVLLSTGSLVLVGLLVVWLLVRVILAGRQTLFLATADTTALQDKFNNLSDWISNNQNSNPVFLYFINYIYLGVEHIGNFSTQLFYQSSTGLQLPYIGWFGMTVLLTWVALAVGNVRVAILTAAVLLFFVFQGLWSDAMATFSVVIAAVFVSLVIGLLLGIWAGVNDRVHRILTPILDFMQIMPSFAYLAPIALIFSIGVPAGIILTFIYAVPPVIRITAHGIRQVPASTREAADSLGVTGFQLLRTVLLPMAKRTIVIGINQTTMAALSMVTIASLIAVSGLGTDVEQALQSLDVGTALNSGLAIVLMAIMFDRVTTAASVRAETAVRAGRQRKIGRRITVGAGLVVTAVAIYLSQYYVWAAEAPTTWPNWGQAISDFGNSVTTWLQDHLSVITTDFRDGITNVLLNRLESLLTGSPFWMVGIVLLVIAFLAGGWRTTLWVLVMLAAMVALGVWSDAMVTLAATIFATVLVMIFGIIFGVWMGRSRNVDRILRPLLDAGQTMPAFVYLVPFLILFGSSRFTAIVAALVYAAPAAIKIIADGISQVPADTIEAVTSLGATKGQIITRVQIPMSMKAIGLAANQGLIYSLSMVVIGGLVGAGALGYDVYAGLSQLPLFGKGLAAGLTLVALGILLDRITQAAATRSGRRARRATESSPAAHRTTAPAVA